MTYLTDDEKAEHRRLRALKAWGPRFYELERRAAEEASDAWRKTDVWDVRPGGQR